MTTSRQSAPIAVALHGGSGTIRKDNLTNAQEAAYRSALAEAREAAWDLLESGASALDAVEAAARSMEDCPLFNAGRGSVLTASRNHEMDAAIMCGHTSAAGAVAGVRSIRNPVSLARKVMDSGQYVLLAGDGAEAFANHVGIKKVPPDWFTTEERRAQLERVQHRQSMIMDHNLPPEDKFGTIGVVALDRQGNLAAATSTGGLTNKRFGRVGDSPLIGAGTFAENATCAVSCTGYGEEFIRAVVAHDVAARMRYKGESLAEASRQVVCTRLPQLGGSGGMVAVDATGQVALPFNTEGMYRAWRTSPGSDGVAIFDGE